jgi:excinuclease UvrABC nuclease subunit
MTIQEIAEELTTSRKSIEFLQAPNKPGVYGFFSVSDLVINDFPSNIDGLIYIGSSSSLSSR